MSIWQNPMSPLITRTLIDEWRWSERRRRIVRQAAAARRIVTCGDLEGFWFASSQSCQGYQVLRSDGPSNVNAGVPAPCQSEHLPTDGQHVGMGAVFRGDLFQFFVGLQVIAQLDPALGGADVGLVGFGKRWQGHDHCAGVGNTQGRSSSPPHLGSSATSAQSGYVRPSLRHDCAVSLRSTAPVDLGPGQAGIR